MYSRVGSYAAVVALILAACGLAGASRSATTPAAVDGVRIRNANSEPGAWMSWGRTYNEQRFSPLTQINDKTVTQLGLAWSHDYDTYRGNEATPVVVDGVLYTTGPWNITTAHDAKTGAVMWRYDPKVVVAKGRDACCDVVTRGLAIWKGKVIIATLDGRVIALDARNGQRMWSTDTFAGEGAFPYTITGAPRVFDGKVLIGNGGADFNARGYVSALDVDTGKLLWRFYTVPGDPSKPYESKTLEMAAKTWTGDNYWKTGGGGTAWDSIVYDPDQKLIFIGTGNGSPWSRAIRSPGGGDNLFLSSIVAVKADTGEYVWHYQEVPGDEWDYTATQPMMLADLKIDGRVRKVLMQAPKNGFFYVIDRTTGKLISAKPFSTQTWAKSIDPVTGRADVNESARYKAEPILVYPGGFGAHNWNPMSFSPKTGLVYLGVTDQPRVYSDRPASPDPYADVRRRLAEQASKGQKAWLAAWDPVAQKEVWRAPHALTGNGGTLATAGNLVLQGDIDKKLVIYAADTGRKLWEYDAQTVPIAGPISYSVDGEQYFAVNVGWGGGLAHVEQAFSRGMHVSKARLLVFKLDGQAKLPPLADAAPIMRPPLGRQTAAAYAEAETLFEARCAICHGPRAAGGIKDLRRMSPETRAQFNAIVRGGVRAAQGMASFADVIDERQAAMLLQYLNARTNEDWEKL